MMVSGKRYGIIDFISCVCMSVGLIFFVLAGSTLQPSFNSIGVLLMSGALCADAAIGKFAKCLSRFLYLSLCDFLRFSLQAPSQGTS